MKTLNFISEINWPLTKIEVNIEVIETVKEVIEAVIKNVIMLAFSAKSETKKLATPPAAQATQEIIIQVRVRRVQIQITRNMLVSAWPIHVQVWRGVSNTSTAI